MKYFITFIIMLSGFCSLAQVDCDLTLQTTIEGFNVYHHNPSGATMYKAKMYIDADGSPRAYGPNNSGLDWTANAGYTGNWWGIVTDGNGDPILQGSSDPYPGMYVSTTSLVNSAYGTTNPLRYTNSETVPFFVLPSAVVSLGGIRIGDIGYVYNTQTGQGCFAIYADTGPSGSLGEGSIYLAEQIGINSNPRTGGTSLGIIDYIVFPYSGYGQGTIPTIAQIDSIGNSKIATVGGFGITQCLETSPGDHVTPTTQVAVPAGWDTTAFAASFTDADNAGGSGIEKSFYQVCDYSNNEWRANNTHGFFNDNFDLTSINPEWTTYTGTWSIYNNKLLQSDESLSNTNIYAPLTQNLSNRYLYHWKATMNGSGSNRRAGFHFFADQPDSSNRGNSYFVWFRLDDQKIQIYKVVNNSWGSSPVKDTAHTFVAGQEYDFKVIYDRITGLIRVYVNDILSATWTDSSPISNGSYVSFRSGNCTYQVDDFSVFRSRYPSVTITVGTGNSNDIRFQNENPAQPAGRISSIVSDVSGNLSTMDSQTINVDWTPPSTVSVFDGTSSDIDTTNNGSELQANWTSSSDANSGVENYFYAIGTTPGGTDILNWTDNVLNLSMTENNLTLTPLQNYYVSVKVKNGAGMFSSATSSDGQLYNFTSIEENHENQNFIIYPNPNSGKFTVQFNRSVSEDGKISISDLKGNEIYSNDIKQGDMLHSINLTGKANGTYILSLSINKKTFKHKILLER